MRTTWEVGYIPSHSLYRYDGEWYPSSWLAHTTKGLNDHTHTLHLRQRSSFAFLSKTSSLSRLQWGMDLLSSQAACLTPSWAKKLTLWEHKLPLKELKEGDHLRLKISKLHRLKKEKKNFLSLSLKLLVRLKAFYFHLSAWNTWKNQFDPLK